jgi:hypothetical protein
VFVAENMSVPQQQGITADNHHPNISVDELLEVIRGANVMPVLLITSSDGRLSAVAVTGLQNVVLSNHEVHGSTEKKHQDFRAWLLLIMSLAATVTFTAGLNPPGGVSGPPTTRKKGTLLVSQFCATNFPRDTTYLRPATRLPSACH